MADSDNVYYLVSSNDVETIHELLTDLNNALSDEYDKHRHPRKFTCEVGAFVTYFKAMTDGWTQYCKAPAGVAPGNKKEDWLPGR